MNVGEETRLCANEGCRRPAAPREPFCESCFIERSLFRREERPGSFRAAAREKRTVEFPGR
jgi:hypothetical protein